MRRFALLPVLLMLLSPAFAAEQYVTIIRGLDGSEEYGRQFSGQADRLLAAAETTTAKQRVKMIAGEAATRENVLSHFATLNKTLEADDRVIVFLVGHGTWDGFEYKFNIAGPDLTGADFVDLFNALPAKSPIVVALGSSSGVLQTLLKDDARTVITATRSGEERLATRFAGYFTNALEDAAADTNKNQSVSLQEAFDYAQRKVKDYYEEQGQLATEHPVISGKGGSSMLARTGKRPQQAADSELAELLARRERLDAGIEQLQLRKSEMEMDAYMNELQQLMIDLSLVQDMIDKKEQAGAK